MLRRAIHVIQIHQHCNDHEDVYKRQIGGGTGQAIATAVGAIGGAIIGSKVEEKMSQVTVSYTHLIEKNNDRTR